MRYTIYFFCIALIGLWVAVPTLQAAPSAAQSVAPTVTRAEPDTDVATGGAISNIIGGKFSGWGYRHDWRKCRIKCHFPFTDRVGGRSTSGGRGKGRYRCD